ncbi:hypothetical protein C0Q70_11544 [Pomacea canaliculata]|uniref:Sulfatase N-terminal domain-containing protein n=1 Tax=Pomacea canaliculata TaxID=400727 RepID=A0A2T7P6A3_POMCA|nr:hypothetical protein C0Q70_11544 [Pomacea canaliculata]
MSKSGSSSSEVKFLLSQGGTRSVGFIHSRTHLRKAGRTYSGLVHAVDWLPTLLAAAGSNGSDVDLPRNIDGMNLWEQIKIGIRSPRLEFVYNIDDVKDNAALRMGRFKLLSGNPGKPNDWANPPSGARPRAAPKGRVPDVHLFDLDVDPAETRNIADRRPKTVTNMLQKLEKYKQGVVPTRRGHVMKLSNPRLHNNTWSPGFC